MTFTADLDAFLSDFAIAATLPSTAVVRGILDNGFDSALGMTGSEPAFVGRSADLDGLSYGAAITIGATAYTVRGVQPDGTGLTRLILER